MRAVVVREPGDPDVLRIGDLPEPHAAPGEVLIAVKAAGVTRADALQRRGAYPPPPGASDILGLEVSGTVAELGEGVSGMTVGEPVCALLAGGGYAEFACANAGTVLPIPEGWSFVEAASLPENMFTVYDNVFTRARFAPGERILIHGGSSGIGTTAIMLAKAFGASFIAATAGSAQKCAACRELGADLAIDYKSADFVAAVLEATGAKGVDVILDMVGGDYIARDVDSLAFDGRVACIASAQGSTAQVNLSKMLQKRSALLASSLRARSPLQKAQIAAELEARVWPLLPARDPIRPVIDSTFPLDQAALAHRRLESSQHIGKIVLAVNAE